MYAKIMTDFALFNPGIENPMVVGNFVVKRPGYTVRHGGWVAADKDPYPILEETTIDEGDILLASPVKSGK